MPAVARFLRSAAEYLSRDRVVRRRMPRRFGGAPPLVSPDSALSYWRFDLDRGNGGPALAAAGRVTRPGDRVFDVGANLGLFAFAAAAVAGPGGEVVAVEADPFLVHLLQRSAGLQTNPRAGVRVIAAAAADRLGTAEFLVARRGRSSSHLAAAGGRATAGGARAGFTTQTMTVDWLAEQFGPPTVLKVGLYGAEAAVLAGAARTLAAARPRVVVEVGPAAGPAAGPLSTLAGYEADVFPELPT
jgi:FkbM family methyltransferase